MSYATVCTGNKWDFVNPKNKEIIVDFIMECKSRKLKNSTISQYNNDLRILGVWVMEHCENKIFTELRKRDFRNYVLWLTESHGVSNARANRLMSCCRSLLNYLEDSDDYDYIINQAGKIKGLPREPVKDIVFLTDEAIKALYDHFMETKQYQDATLLGLAYESAGRRTELFQVKKDSIKEERNNTNVVVGKRGKKFSLLYFDMTKNACKKYLEQRGDDNNPYLFIGENRNKKTSPETIYDKIVKWRDELKKLTGEELNFNVHSFRHSSLENYSNGTHEVCKRKRTGKISIEKLKLIANHESIATTQAYLRDRTESELEELFSIKIN